MRNRGGLTLVEIAIALFILAVGILAAFGLQTNALRGTRTAEITQTMTNIAESELQLQREFERHVTHPVSGETCRSQLQASTGFTCSVDVYPCSLSGGALSCVNATVADAVARQITVRLTGPSNTQLQMSTVVQ